ncbi:MAG: DUF4386 domain-containing protein [Gammaproteobacteria bacterium]|nr:DUF4386 domain-containing protein [Gammaproteobacteria bacterium]
MRDFEMIEPIALARRIGLVWLATLLVGILAVVLLGQGIDINLSADVEAVAVAMLDAETRLRALAYAGLLIFALDLLVSLGLFLLLRSAGPLLAAWSLAARLMAGLLSVLGTVFLMNSAEIASRPAYTVLADSADRLLLNGLQATSNYTSFHLSIVLSSAALAGFFWLFLKSGQIPKLIAGWGLFASLFVASTIVLRDFIPALGHVTITMAFMISNLIALFSTSIYMAAKGVRVE